jgi:Ca-activated chloride channel family protein
MGKGIDVSFRWMLVASTCVTIAAGAAGIQAADGPPSWCAFAQAEASDGGQGILTPRSTRYDVDVLGSVAIGALALQFENGGPEAIEIVFSARRPTGFRLDSLTFGSSEGADAQPLEFEFEKAVKRERTRGKSSPQQAIETAFQSEALELAAEESVWVRISFTQELRFAGDRFLLSLPVVGGSCAASGTAPVSPLDVVLRVHHDQPLELAESSTHELLIEFEGDHTVAELVAPDVTGETSFEFAFALGRADEPVLTGFVSPERETGERDVLLVFAPAVSPDEGNVRPKEVLFVLDTSGSMRGAKIDVARSALLACLQKLRPVDRFNLVEFDASFTSLFEVPEEASATALQASGVWLAGQRTGGATTLLPALAATFDQPRGTDHHRLVVVLTDGAIGDQAKVLEFLQERLGEARLFFVGVGAEPNRAAVNRLAEFGRGTAAFADDPEGFGLAVQQLFDGISAPMAWDLQIDWAGAEVLEMQPKRLPDLYSGRPVTVRARIRGELPPTLVLEAETTRGAQNFEALLPSGGAVEFPQLRSAPRRGGVTSKGRAGVAR